MAQYKNYAGQLVTCPKQEGTCWQPDHLTKTQLKIQTTKNRFSKNDPAPYEDVLEGTAGDDSYVSVSSYDMYMYNYGNDMKMAKRPKHTAGAAMFDFAKEALGEDTNVHIMIDNDKEDGRTGIVTVATAIKEKANGGISYLDWVDYQYETVDGNTKFYKKKMFGRKEVTPTDLQEDIAASRSKYGRSVDNAAGAG